MLTFQELILRLTQFWEKKGCVIHQGHDLEVGAGTFNPATFLRCLGPEPYNTAYVEPSRRPADARFGQNPNRLHLFHQFQVILKPSPPDIQQLYLKSLETLGLKLSQHDIRFVHDDWESPTLGAWGLGWEVWCDGMEISQFTYFQAMASLPLHPVSGEITYGLERLCMYLQNVDNIFDIRWNDTLTLGDISKTSEVEWSTYNFSVASSELWLKHFDDYEKEAKRLISLHLPFPAYDFVIKASHAFNLLDARGVLSTTERTRYIGRIRDLSRLVALEYTAAREKEGFPLLKETKPAKKIIAKKPPSAFDPHKKSDFLLEIGSEQLPASFVPIGCAHLEKAVRTLLETHALSFEEISVFGTPRRLAVLVKNLAHGSLPKTVEKKGPPLSVALDTTGKWTPQGEGFFKSLGIQVPSVEAVHASKVKNVEIRLIKEAPYLFATLHEKGKSTAQLLATHLPALIENLEFPKKMHWGALSATYARPVRWIVSLLSDTVIPFVFADTVSSRFTYGHAQRDPAKITLPSASDYLSILKQHFVLADPAERKGVILESLKKIERETNTAALAQDILLPEVVHLVEWPELTYAPFNPSYLTAPAEVLISEMVEHQKYFPLAQKDKLQNLFVITLDNTPGDLIRQGNQKVLSARLADGIFLYEQDCKIPLEQWNEKLKEMTFHKELGSVWNKVERITQYAPIVEQHLFGTSSSPLLQRAALLSKADLASSCVKEFPHLQGIMGKYIALAQKEDPLVATALEEQWMPKGEGAQLPQTKLGIILSVADKIDNFLCYYSASLKPTSSSDPYGLRRQALGLIKILITGKHALDLHLLLKSCAVHFTKISAEGIQEILQFLTARTKTVFEEYGFAKDESAASIKEICVDPYDQFCKVTALHTFRKNPAFLQLLQVYKRAKGQLQEKVSTPLNRMLLQEDAEKALFEHLESLEPKWRHVLAHKEYAKAYTLIAELQPFVAKLFDTVKILVDEENIRTNRLALLQRLFSYFEELLDWGSIKEN